MKRLLFVFLIIIFYTPCNTFAQEKQEYRPWKDGIQLKFEPKIDSILKEAVYLRKKEYPDILYFLKYAEWCDKNGTSIVIFMYPYIPNGFELDSLGNLRHIAEYLITKTNRYVILGEYELPVIYDFDFAYYWVNQIDNMRAGEALGHGPFVISYNKNTNEIEIEYRPW